MGILIKSLETFKKSLTFTPVDAAWRWGSGGLADEHGYHEVGDGANSSLVEACVSWISNQVTATNPSVRRFSSEDDVGERDRNHPAARLVRHPTFDPRVGRSYYSWIPLIQATMSSLTVSGNSVWRKRRSRTQRPVQLWYQPYGTFQPHRYDRSSYFIDYWEISGGGQTDRVDPADIIHFRDGINPLNPLLGMSKLQTLLREIYTDEQAARWTASLLRNQSVPGMIVAPDQGAQGPSENEAKEIKARLMADFSGDHRGEPMVLGAPTKIHQYGYSPDQMKLGELRDIPEERVSAALGVPAAVVGFGSGLQTAKVGATMGELVDLGWQNGVLPRLRLLAAELTEQLLPDFGADDDLEFYFDTSEAPIMAEYQNKVSEKHERLVRSNIETRAEARRAVGLRASKDDDVYTLQAGVTILNPDGTPQVEPPEPVALPTPPAGEAQTPPQAALPANTPKVLTDRQSDIAEMLEAGMVQKKIAADLGISLRTVEREVANIRQWREMAGLSASN